MTMQGIEQVVGETAYDAVGNKVGSVGHLYTSDTSGNPEWVTVNTGLFGSKHTFVPLAGARVETDGLHLAPSKSKIKDAPRIDSNGHLSEREASELYRYYGLTLPQRNTPGRPNMAGDQPMPGADGKMRAGGTGDNQLMRDGDNQMMPAGDNSMVRSEERLRPGTETVRGEEQVSETVRKEQVEVEGLADDARKPGNGRPGEHRKH
ncbi:PRC-barrel domain-containing protein [Kribbella sp. NPDC051952]|uniref:PRC-barrel domain-containing protein n=1 Tax=Kribbella sp. NPDC051952 TaxID=3154851 RepID=UPI0034491A81